MDEAVPVPSVPTDDLVNDSAVNATAFQACPEGMAIAYGSLFIMALAPIIIGSFKSVFHLKGQKDRSEQLETLTGKDAAMFPIYASCALFGLFLVFRYFGKEYINMLLTGYFFAIGIFALSNILSPIVAKLVPPSFPNRLYHLSFTGNANDETEVLLDYKFDRKDLACLVASSVVGIWYILKKHWIANNLFGLAFAINGVEYLQLGGVKTGCILLGGLFVYDIFWVFGTNVMVTVATSFEAPIKLVFPQDLIEHGFLGAEKMAMLGLGDIVIPGIFIALLLRYDASLNRKRNTYFNTCFLAYIFGLATTIFVMHFFKHAQPALLYLVPSCLTAPLFVALVKGDLVTMFSYRDDDTTEEVPSDNKKVQ